MSTTGMAVRNNFWRSRRFRDALVAYLFILPWVIGFIIFTGGPIVASFVLSFFRWKMIAPPKFYGLTHYIKMLTTDELFRTSIWVTFKFVLISVPIGQVLALGLALLLNQRIRGLGFWRSAFHLPAVVSGVAGSVIWVWMYHTELRIVNNGLLLLGIEGRN